MAKAIALCNFTCLMSVPAGILPFGVKTASGQLAGSMRDMMVKLCDGKIHVSTPRGQARLGVCEIVESHTQESSKWTVIDLRWFMYFFADLKLSMSYFVVFLILL